MTFKPSGTIEEVLYSHITENDIEHWLKTKPKEMSRSEAIKLAKERGWIGIRDGKGAIGADPIYFREWNFIENEKHQCIIYSCNDKKRYVLNGREV